MVRARGGLISSTWPPIGVYVVVCLTSDRVVGRRGGSLPHVLPCVFKNQTLMDAIYRLARFSEFAKKTAACLAGDWEDLNRAPFGMLRLQLRLLLL